MTKALRASLRRLLSGRPEVSAAFAFGSRARGKERPGSDLDVGVLLSPRVPPRKRFDAALALRDDLERGLGLAVDVVVLNDCDPFLRWQVLSARTPVLERAPAALGPYREKAMADYWDFLPLMRACEGAAAARLVARTRVSARQRDSVGGRAGPFQARRSSSSRRGNCPAKYSGSDSSR